MKQYTVKRSNGDTNPLFTGGDSLTVLNDYVEAMKAMGWDNYTASDFVRDGYRVDSIK